MQRQKVIPKPTLETQSGVSLQPSSAFPFTLSLAAPVGNVCRVGACGLSGEGRMLRMSWGKLGFKQSRDCRIQRAKEREAAACKRQMPPFP